MNDPAFASSIEKAYLHALSAIDVRSTSALLNIHLELLEDAIFKSDPTNGGIRFKRLAEAPELEARLNRALSIRLKRKRDDA